MKSPVAKALVGPTGGRPRHIGPKFVKIGKLTKAEEAKMAVKALREVKKP